MAIVDRGWSNSNSDEKEKLNDLKCKDVSAIECLDKWLSKLKLIKPEKLNF